MGILTQHLGEGLKCLSVLQSHCVPSVGEVLKPLLPFYRRGNNDLTVIPSVTQLVWESKDPNLGMFSPQWTPSKQHRPPRAHPILLRVPTPPSTPRLSTGTSQTLRIQVCHIGWPIPGQREGKRCLGREVGMSTVRGNGGWAASSQLGALPWVLSLAQNCREEKKRPQRRKKPHRVRAKQEDNMQEGPRRGKPATTYEEPDTTGCHRKCLCGRP